MKVRCIDVGDNNSITHGKVYEAKLDRYFDTLGYKLMSDDKGKKKWYLLKRFEEVNEMTKSDLVPGKHVVELRDGCKCIVMSGFVVDANGYVEFKDYDENLLQLNRDYSEFDIVAVYKIPVTDLGNIFRCEEEIWRRNDNQEKYDKLIKRIQEEEDRHKKLMNELKAQAEKLKL